MGPLRSRPKEARVEFNADLGQVNLRLNTYCCILELTLIISNVINKPHRTLAAVDFTSLVWITYRSHFHPIRDSSLTVLEREQTEAAAVAPAGVQTLISSGPPSKRWWLGGEKGWTSDAGWGCMLRTGQSLLETALVHLHLGQGM